MKNDFNRVSKSYQRLSKLVFGDRLIQAQVLNLKHLRAKDRVLIVGGGNGEILDHLPKELGLQIIYVELSSEMINLAKSRNADLDISFYQQDVRSFKGEYDAVIANFFLDCFNDESLTIVLQKLKTFLSPKGKLLITDFDVPRTRYDQFLLWLMHRFFGVFSNLESESLLPIQKRISTEGYQEFDLQVSKKPRLFSGAYRLAH